MTAEDQGTQITTRRLLLRPWRAEDAVVMRRLWTERDPRVPAHRRIDAQGNPTLAEVERRILEPRGPLGLLAAEDRATGRVLGYCGLVATEVGTLDEPEIAFEFLRATWDQGLATEAGTAVVDWARDAGLRRLWATVWDWNVASRRVLTKLGFVETERTVASTGPHTTIVTVLDLDSAGTP